MRERARHTTEEPTATASRAELNAAEWECPFPSGRSPFLSPARPFRPSSPLARAPSFPALSPRRTLAEWLPLHCSVVSSVLRSPMRLHQARSCSLSFLSSCVSPPLDRPAARSSLSLFLSPSPFSHFSPTAVAVPPRFSPLSPRPPLNSYITLSFFLCFSFPLERSLFLHDRIVYVLRTGIAARNCPSHSGALCSLPARRY